MHGYFKLIQDQQESDSTEFKGVIMVLKEFFQHIEQETQEVAFMLIKDPEFLKEQGIKTPGGGKEGEKINQADFGEFLDRCKKYVKKRYGIFSLDLQNWSRNSETLLANEVVKNTESSEIPEVLAVRLTRF